MGKGDGVGNGAVSRDMSRKTCGPIEACAHHQRFGALVHIAETLLQAHHRLPARREPEMAGLDDAGVHGTHRNPVQALAFGRQERIGAWRLRRCRCPGCKGLLHAPATMVEPGSRVGQARRPQSIEVVNRSLQADRGGMNRAD